MAKGNTTVRTPWGYAFVSGSGTNVDEHGIKVTKTEAEALVEESDGLVYITDEDPTESVTEAPAL